MLPFPQERGLGRAVGVRTESELWHWVIGTQHLFVPVTGAL